MRFVRLGFIARDHAIATDRFYGQRRMLLLGPEGQVVDVSLGCAPDPTWLASLA